MATAILRQPAGWPSVLLGRAGKAAAADGLAGAEKRGAWAAWKGAVRQGPEAVIRAVGDAGLRGRGGAGYPTADKWRAVRAQAAPVRYAVANGYEADPGTMVDRTLMEVDPHAVLEGLALAAFAVGAEEAFLVVRADAALAIERLTAALAAAEAPATSATTCSAAA